MEHNKNHLQLLNIINRSRQFSKDKTKTQMALYTISTELNKIKNISKRKKPSTSLFNNIPVPDTLTMKPKLKKNNSNSYLNTINQMNTINHNRTRSASHSPNHLKQKEILNTCPNSVSNTNSSHVIRNKISSNFNMIPKTSFERSKLKNEIDSLKRELKMKDDIIKVKDEKIESLEKNLEISQHNISCIKARYLKMKEQLNNALNEIKNLKILNEQAQNEIKFMNEKELKLMQVIYLVKERGINIDEILNDVSQMNSLPNSSSSRSEISKASTVYFPDKVKMEESKEQNVPKLDFASVPTYKSSSHSETENNIDVTDTYQENEFNIIQQGNMKFNKIDFTHEENNDNNIYHEVKGWNSAKITPEKLSYTNNENTN